MTHLKKIMSVSSAILLAGALTLSSVSAETENNETSTKVESTGSNALVPTLYSTPQAETVTGTLTIMPVTTNVRSVDMGADRNNDGTIDTYEQCAFVQKKSEKNCSSAKEAAKKKLWQQFGSGAYNPNAFERNQNNGIIMKKINMEQRDMKKEMKQEMKDNRTGSGQMMGSGAQDRKELKNEMKQQKRELKQEAKVAKKVLSETLHAQLATAVAKLSTEKLNKVIANIDKAAAKITASSLDQDKKDNFLAQLEEIRVVIQDKIDAIAGMTSTGSILNEVLSGATSTGTTSTGTTSTGTTSTGTTSTGTVTQ